ncbi:hypothetical protein M3225_26695 [Priestia aryabhattai]|uniref:hypothetical protein n=1 Tax=Priestia aryabhattai TaxID=412384 RepID=UPI00203A959E|nr:hypothetical protein [Priestia aryabhattai]MCM3774008.1 hypothetical protein [Priestia aryabhattai]
MNINEGIRKAEIRRANRLIGIKYAEAQHKSQIKGDQFAIFHLGQALAFEEAIRIIKMIFHDEMRGEDWE